MRKRAHASVLQRFLLKIPLHNDVEVGTMDKETGDFTPAQAAVHDPHRASLVTLATPAAAMTRRRHHRDHKGIA
jgi:hypothetical protein